MKGDLIINEKDAFTEWGISMSDKFIPTIKSPAPMKELIENESRLEHGKRVITDNPKVDSRTITLTFHMMGRDKAQYDTRYDSFINELYGLIINIKVPDLGDQVYRLIYKKHTSFSENYGRTSGKISVQFEEPDPMDRA